MTQRWCGESKFSDGDLVREKKLLLFLQEVVLPMRTVPRTRKSMSQKLDSKRKRNAASKRRKRAKIARKNGKNVVEAMPPQPAVQLSLRVTRRIQIRTRRFHQR